MLNPSKQEARLVGEKETVSFLPMEAIGEDGSLILEQEKEIGECLNGYTYFKEGDVCIAKITPCFENGKGAILRDLKGGIGFGTTELIVARPRTEIVKAQFLDYLFRSSTFRSLGEAAMYGAGGQKRVPDSFVRDFASFLPPIAEQSAISAFLDRETAKIDALIAEQQRLIELLQEKRQAVISHAVTKGLNPDALMKDSGIEWLGEVPEHWTLTRLDRISDFVNGKAHEPHVSDDGQFICVTSRFISTNGEAVRLCAENLTPAVRDDILMVMSDLPNGRALARTFHVQDERDYAINQRVCAIRPTGASPRYLAFMLDRNPWFLQNDDGLNQTHLSVSDFRKMPIVLPPQGDQDAIAQRLDSLVAISAHLIAHAETCITLLQERRAALISAAVTGQIDVRGFSSGGSEAA
jgi:type I restriction enzyme S subunit